MDRCSTRLFITLITAGLGCVLTGCVGKSSNGGGNGTVQTVSLNPSSSVSLEMGATQNFAATARNSQGQSVLTGIQFLSGCTTQLPCAPVSIANNGLACAGSWDSLSFPIVCTPVSPGFAQIVAVSNGVSSAPVTVYVHQHIQSIAVSRVGNPVPDYGCFSQGQTWNYQATVFGPNGTDITSTVGPVAWAGTNGNILTANTTITGLLNNQAQITARNPGITPLFAIVSGATSTPLMYTTCLVQSILLQIQGTTGDAVTINNGGSRSLVATAIDSQGYTLTNPQLTWSTSNPVVATVTSSGTVNGKQNPGGATISASCTPPTCNTGVLPGLPVYSSNGTLPNGQSGYGVISVNVTAAKPPTYTAWAATTGCSDNLNCNSNIFSVTPGGTPIQSGTTLPYTPNSLVFTPAGTRAYLGSSKGLMFVDFGLNPTVSTVSQATIPCAVSLCGKVLAISPDGTRVLIADTNDVYIYSTAANTPPVVLTNISAVAAAFSPDQMKIFIIGSSGTLHVYSSVDSLSSTVILGTPTDLAFSADGSFAYLAGAPTTETISGYSVCTTAQNAPYNVLNFTSAQIVAPLKLSPLPDLRTDSLGRQAQSVVALDPPYIDVFTVGFVQKPPVATGNPVQYLCQPPAVASDDADFPTVHHNLGQGPFTPVFMQVVGNGTTVIVAAQNVGAVLALDLSGGTTTQFGLANNGVPLVIGGSPSRPVAASTDGSVVFVSACEAFEADGKTCKNGSIHIVNPANGGDVQQVQYLNANTNNSMCNNLAPNAPPCLPDLIAIKPQ